MLVVEDLTDLRGELLDAERLGQKVGARTEHAIVHEGVARLACRMQNSEGGEFLDCDVCKLPLSPCRGSASYRYFPFLPMLFSRRPQTERFAGMR